MGIVGFHLVIDQHIDGVLLPCVFEEIFLSPALEHAIGHVDGGQIPAAGEGRRLMPVRAEPGDLTEAQLPLQEDRKSTRLNSSHGYISYAVFCLKKKKKTVAATTHSRSRVS